MIFLEYPKCSTCRKAKAWLDAHQINYTDRHIVEDNPSAAELAAWHHMSRLPLKKFFNTSGILPLRYNNDKQKKPLFSRGLSVCRLLFNSFSKLKIDENYKEKRRLFY